jgi:hypothetical protein
MRYCKNCKSKWDTGYRFVGTGGNYCPFCEEFTVGDIPDYETLQQYKERTGEEWSGAVYVRGGLVGDVWRVTSTEEAKERRHMFWYAVVVCTSRGKPPADWIPK